MSTPDQDMKEVLKEIKTDVAKSVVEEVTPELTKSVLEAVKSEIKDTKGVHGSDDAVMQKKEEAAEYIRAKMAGDSVRAKALSTGSTGNGEELVPEYVASEMTRLAPVYGQFRRNARVVPMPGKTLQWPTLGNVTAYRVGETVRIPSSQPPTSQMTLTLQKLAALVPMSNELLKDASIDVVDAINRLGAEAIGRLEDKWGFLGLAAGEGILQNADVPTLTMSTGGNTYSEATLDNLLALMGLVDEAALPGAKFYLSFSLFNSFRGVKNSDGDYILQAPGAGMPATLWNYPVEFISQMPKTTDAGSQASKPFAIFGNLDYALLGDAREYSVEISNEATITDVDGSTLLNLFERDMSAVRIIERIDIEIAEPNAFAVLETAAS